MCKPKVRLNLLGTKNCSGSLTSNRCIPALSITEGNFISEVKITLSFLSTTLNPK